MHGSAKSSVSTSCAGAPQSPNYDIKSGTIARDATANGAISSSVAGATRAFTCTLAAPKKELPAFQYDPGSYNPAPHEFTSISAFNTFTAPLKNAIEGTFYVQVANPSQANRIDITNWNLSGDVTIITNAPIYSDRTEDSALSSGEKAKLVLVTTYDVPETGLQCLLEGQNHEQSECAIHFKNHMQASCNTAVLFHAKNGPVAIKNNNDMCGSIMSDGVQVKNNQKFNYDSRFNRVTGFGNPGYELARWQECSVDGCD